MLRELDALEAQDGVDVSLAPLLRNRETVSHPTAERWTERAWFTPFASRRLARDALRYLRSKPRSTARSVAEPLARVARTPNFLVGTLGILLKSLHLARRMEEEGVTHVHAHFATHPAMAAWIIHRVTGIPYSFTAHAHDIYVHTAMLAEKVRDAAFVVTISEHNRALLARYGDVKKIHVVHSGIALDRYEFRDAPPPGPFTILSVASLQPYKGLDNLVRACALLRDRGRDFRCVVAGGGELREELERLVRELGLGDLVVLVGPQPEDEVARLLREAHVFALPSVVEPSGKMEGLPVVLIEALAVGLPAVASSISGIPEIVRDGETGRLVAPRDPGALAAALSEVMDDPAAASARARRGRELVEAEFALERNVARLRGLFEGVAASR